MIINAIVAYYEAVNCTISTVTLRSVGSREMACRLADKEMIVLSCAQANKRLMSVCKESSLSMHTDPRLLLSVRHHDAWCISRPLRLSP